MTPFEVKDCALLIRMSGLPPAINLRELRERIAVCSGGTLYHHFCETTLRPTFDNPDYRNDFAVWAKLYLGDRILAERLGIMDPYSFASMEDLRVSTLERIDERLGETPMIPWARPGDEFFFMEATTVVFDADIRIEEPAAAAQAIGRMSRGSIYYHFLEALRRPPIGKDDFTAWLIENGGSEVEPYVRAIASIDFFFHNLSRLQRELVNVLSGLEASR
jgi:hypothetical protein